MPAQMEEKTTSPAKEDALVNIERLKVQRSKLKTKITNISKRLVKCIDSENDCYEIVKELQNSMDEFNNVHDDYCALIECEPDLDQFRVVNELDLDKYYDLVSNTFHDAMLKYRKFTSSKEVNDIKHSVELLTERLKNVCDSLKSAADDPMQNSIHIDSHKCEIDTMVNDLLHVLPKLLAVDSSPEVKSFAQQVKKVVLYADEVKLSCSSRHSVTRQVSATVSETDQSQSKQFDTHKMSLSGKHDSVNYNADESRQTSDFGESRKNFSLHSEKRKSDFYGDYYLRKTPLPEFSGSRKDWPEFKAVWKEIAESTIHSRTALAYELKRCLKGSAKEKVQNIYITKSEAYESIWERLCEFYDDVGASVQTALDGLYRLKAVQENDFKGLVHLIDSVEAAFSQLEELNQVEVLSMRDIDKICELLPCSLRMIWIRQYHKFDDQTKLKPLSNFMEFLRTERAAVARLAESSSGQRKYSQSHFATEASERVKSGNKPLCAIHKNPNVKHKTEDCKDFRKLPLDDKYQSLKNVHACFNCFGLHRRDKCKVTTACRSCRKVGHHYLLCKRGNSEVPSCNDSRLKSNANSGNDDSKSSVADSGAVQSSSHHARDPGSVSLYAIHEAFVVNSGKMATVFCDNGSNTSYITHSAAERLRAKRLEKYTLGVTTMGNVDREYSTRLYEVSIRTLSGKVIPVLAFGMSEITGPVSQLDEDCLSRLLPSYDISMLQRKSRKVDILLGCDYFGLHPKQEIFQAGDHLSVMKGDLGVCIQGYHSDLKENTEISTNMVRTLHEYKLSSECYQVQSDVHPAFRYPDAGDLQEKASTYSCANLEKNAFNFAVGEELATEINPRCGNCKCGKCPVLGHSYSFKEEQELSMIRSNLVYDEKQKCWITSYPWILDPENLPDNYSSAFATLRSTERTLARDPDWASKYSGQIQDMLNRGVARKLTGAELRDWDGPKFYIAHLAVHNPNSKSTPVRIVFNSSQMCSGVSLNSALAKGPDSYLNNLIGLLLRWREGHVAFVGDVKKMFNSVHLQPLEQHCHRFLWRDLDEARDPDIYVMTRVNMGDRPAPAISTEALYKTADRFRDDSPAAADILCKSSYVDDIIDSVSDFATAVKVTAEVEEMLKKGGFQIKCWQYSGECGARTSSGSTVDVSLLKGSGEFTRVLGISWDPVEDLMLFKAELNFSKKKRGVRTGPPLTRDEIPDGIPDILTRRIVLEQVMSIFDPLGFLCPFTLLGKVYLRETWLRKLDWDDALPPDLHSKWIQFFQYMLDLEHLQFERCLKPEGSVGHPWLILLSDGSDIAYGFAAYIRWQLENGEFWCRLIFAKCRIAPVAKLSTPQMELNGAVLSKRGRKVIEKEMRIPFERVIHIVDSETVLCMLNKTSTRFKVYEGVRIGEIQAATHGNMGDWAWVNGKSNTADMLTRGKFPFELRQNSEWWNGPSFLYKPSEEWGLKFGLLKNTSLPGERKISSASHSSESRTLKFIDYSRFSSIKVVHWVLARLIGVLKSKSFKGGRVECITPELLRKAEKWVVADVQSTMHSELEKSRQGSVGGKYAALKPFKNVDGLWCVGLRLAHTNPMVPNSDPQKLLAYEHEATRLLMKQAHECGHRGRNGTLAKFRENYWTVNGSKLAWQAKNKCQMCRLRDCKLIEQCMAPLPETRLKPSPPFNSVMVDFFGPYLIRGEVQKRTSSKAYGVMFTDLVMRAVHIEPVFGYDTSSFLMALMRFASFRGWPSVIYSDPGSQFIAADSELKLVWSRVDKNILLRKSSENGLKWVMGPADSPWHQGAVESLVKSAKRAIKFSINNQRLSAPEFITLCAEISNTLNERPIGILPGPDSDVNVLTPNSLLLGRSTAKNPGGWQPVSNHLSSRYHLVLSLANHFWAKWVELCAPSLLVQRKWHLPSRNLKTGDIVLIMDKNTLRGDYRLGLVKETFLGSDGKVRKVLLSYKNYKVGEKVCEYSGIKDTQVTRSVQRLALLVPQD